MSAGVRVRMQERGAHAGTGVQKQLKDCGIGDEGSQGDRDGGKDWEPQTG